MRPNIILILSVMSDQKTHSGTAKRFKVTASGKIMHKHARRRHLLRKKTTKAKRNLRGDAVLRECDAPLVKKLLAI